MATTQQKLLGQYFTPDEVASSLVSWVLRRSDDTLLDPACGDGQFLKHAANTTGIDLDPVNCAASRIVAPSARVHEADFFTWAEDTSERFDCVAGNPPFIRYQEFNGDTRRRALRLAIRMGAHFSKLTSSWAPFIVVAAGLLKPGGRLAFVVPAEVGHATYAPELLEVLCRRFGVVHVIALRDKLFPDLSQDAWLLYAEGYGGSTDRLRLTIHDSFEPSHAIPSVDKYIPLAWWRRAGHRLRKFLLPSATLALYDDLAHVPGSAPLGRLGKASIGYVSGANDFFHFTPMAARLFDIPAAVLRPTVRRGGQLTQDCVDNKLVAQWLAEDQPALVLDLNDQSELPAAVWRYLDTPAARYAEKRYKCRVRDPWYAIPGLRRAPDAFISCMSGLEVRLSINVARAVCSNSVLGVKLKVKMHGSELLRAWAHPFSRLSQELEGHPLGGGMLKLEPGEAERVSLPLRPFRCTPEDMRTLHEGILTMRKWRHYDTEGD